MNNGLKGNGHWVTVASCTARHGRPPATITWQSKLEGKANETRNESNGLVTIVSDYQANLTDESEGEKVSCRVEHSSLEKNPWIKEGRIVLDGECYCSCNYRSIHSWMLLYSLVHFTMSFVHTFTNFYNFQ